MSGMSSIKKRWAQWSSILLVLLGMGFGISMLPTGYSEDLSVIGSGKNVAVLVHNKEGVRSLISMGQVDDIREHYKDRIEFRIAESGTPTGAKFAKINKAHEGTLVLFKEDGTIVGKLSDLESSADLTKRLNQVFGY